MNSSNHATGRTPIISEEDCIVQIDNPPNSPKLLKKSAGGKSCCIFRIPHTLVQANETAYNPKIVSIGPYHYFEGEDAKEHLQMIQEHKQRYLDIFLSKIKEREVYLSHLREVVSLMEQRIRSSYSEDLKFGREKLIDMMILDGCFILTLLLVVSKKSWRKNYIDDPIFTLRWILPTLRSDLLLLENQLCNKKAKRILGKKKNLDACHLLDLIRKTYIPHQSPQTEEESNTNIFGIPRKSSCFNVLTHTKNKDQGETPTPPPRPLLGLILSAIKLRLREIEFNRKEKSETPLDITLKNGVLEIPKLTFDDFFSSVLINCVVFEQFNMRCSTEMTSYVTFMGCLINTEEDATFLSEKGIIENYFGTGEQVSLFFKNTGKDIAFSINKSFLANVFEGVNKYTSQGYHVHWAGFKYTHFNSPWAFLSSFAALLFLLLTIIQAFFATYAYFRPPKTN